MLRKRITINSVGMLLVLSGLVIQGCDNETTEANMDDENGTETTEFTVTIENISGQLVYSDSGTFARPSGADEPAPAQPGDSYSFSFHADREDHLSLATMFVHSNDWFYAPGEKGIALFDGDGMPITGDVTYHFKLYDLGTELDQAIGEGADQPARQSRGNSGARDDQDFVREVNLAAFGAPAVSDVIAVSLDYAEGMFTATIKNVSDNGTIRLTDGHTTGAPIAPGVFVVHAKDEAPLFSEKGMDYGLGLERLAEDGDPSLLGTALEKQRGPATPLAPVAYVLHGENEMPILVEGEKDMGRGLETLAETGDPSMLVQYLSERYEVAGAAAVPSGESEAGPAVPGASYSFTVDAKPGDHLSFASMYVKSNDLFFAPGEEGIALFEGNSPRRGDITDEIYLWDVGTEKNEAPGFGPNQPLNQTDGTTPEEESKDIDLVSDEYFYAPANRLIKVTLSVK